ncbi:molybdate ABC transporter substrate-binding protein [Ancylomarina longa]|uniref:Molybdate ABC transporter substrate-binding protein n=1 Tax=Ancylomarina longa TaxID=2487017 RepID=A0A434AGT5_9BACT|nr:molybdate ABC transporter substrate-binding protein [Ancylomarina longa]RUT73604.1 molybdate ABC transporter substrate-binding protein [Ancylomarina longa]
MSRIVLRNSYQLFCFIVLSFLLFSCSAKQKKEKVLTVYTAASVSKVMQQIATDFEKDTGIVLRINVASSGTLARQIEAGANFDYFISASREWMAYVDSLSLVDRGSISTMANNRIVAVVPVSNTDLMIGDSDLSHFSSLFKGRLAIGDPSYVPVGKYAQQIIQKYKWEADLKNRYLPAKDARDALFMVEMGEVEMGMVYYSDALQSKKLRIVYKFPIQASAPIRYYGATGKKQNKTLTLFVNYMQSEKVHQIWVKNGFNHN